MDNVITVISAITFVGFLIVAVMTYRKNDRKYPRLWVLWAAISVVPLARILDRLIPMSGVGSIVVYVIAIAILLIGAFVAFTGRTNMT